MKQVIMIIVAGLLLASCGGEKAKSPDVTKLPAADEAAINYVDNAKSIYNGYFNNTFVPDALNKKQIIEVAYLFAKQNIDLARLKSSCTRVNQMYYDGDSSKGSALCKALNK